MKLNLSIMAALAALAVCACQEESDPIPVGSSQNNEAECRSDTDCEDQWICNRQEECVRGPCIDLIKSIGEVDVDCGGTCGACPDGASCFNDADCASDSCIRGVCQEETVEAPACDDSDDPQRFVLWDNGVSLDISYERGTRGAAPVTAAGVAIADFDLDGDPDVIVTNQGGSPGLFINDGTGNFTLEATSLISQLVQTTSISVADIDADGDPDVVIGRTNDGVYVMVNQGDGTFTEEHTIRGLGELTDVVSSGSFADFDGDGDLDFYLGSYIPPIEVMVPFMLPASKPNRLYRNDGTGVFTEMPYSPGGVGEEGSTLAVAWWDFDADGRPDIWSSNDFGMLQQPSQLWRNGGPDPNDPDGWLWEDISASAGVNVAIFGMSASLADFDNDGDQDGYASNMSQNVLHVVNGATTTNEAVQRGVDCSVVPDPRPAPIDPPEYVARLAGMQPFIDDYTDSDSPYYSLTSWAATFQDFDHDGWQDLHIVNGTTLSDLTPEANFQPNYLFENKGDGTFQQSPCWRLPDIRGTSRGAAAGDLDGDGDMDLIWVDQGDNGDAGVYVLRNEMSDGNWLTVQLQGRAPNLEAIGAKVVVNGGGLTQYRWIDGGQSYMSVSERVAHFGLGAADTVDSVEVTWPDGTVEPFSVTAVNQRITLTQSALVE